VVEMLEDDLFRLDEHRKLIQAFLVNGGTNMLLENVTESEIDCYAALNTYMLILLERGDFTKPNPFDSAFSQKFLLKYWDLVRGCKRSLVKFYRKRTPCHCLDETHAELKPQPKTGVCRHCARRFERGLLKECSICNCVQYCSKECQVADWPSHKRDCKILRQINKTETTC